MDLAFDDLIPSAKKPRGERNNNPLNIEAGAFTQGRQGFAGSDGRFAKFENMDQGFAAADDLLGVYGSKHGINSVRGVISRWAPAGENNVETYAASVAKDLGLGADDKIDLADPQIRSGLSAAMAKFENGKPIPRSTDMSAQSKGLSFDDLIPAAKAEQPAGPDTFAERFAGDKSNPGMKQAPTTSLGQRLLTDFDNSRFAAGQRTTPDMASQAPNLVSDRVYEGDEGFAYYKDDTGAIQRADSAKHVLLRDPNDNKLKLYARTEDTNEGVLASLGRILSPGLATSAPSRLASAAPAIAREVVPAVAPALKEGQQVAAAAERVGVDLPRAVTSDVTGVQYAGKIAANVPIGGTPLRQASQKAIGQMEEATQSARAGYGTGDIASAGAGVREGISGALKSGPIKQRVDELYTKVDGIVDPAVTAPMPNTRNLKNTIEARRTNAARPGSKNVAELDEALSRAGMNYEGIKDLRSHFGEMMRAAKPIPDGMSAAEVKQIYGSLSQDMRLVIARAGGQEGLAAYDKAEKAAKRWADVREDLARVLNIQSEEGIFSKIVAMAGSKSTADMKLLGRVRGAIGADKWDEVSSAVIEKLGRAPDGTFSPDRFIGPSGLGGLSAEGKQMLFRSTGKMSHADSIEDIKTIALRWKSLSQFANPSGTGQTVIGASMGTGLFLDPVTAITSVVGARVFATILAKPATARSTAAWARSYERAATVQTPASLEGFRRASQLLAMNVSQQAGRPDLLPQLTRELQGAITSRAEDKQQ